MGRGCHLVEGGRQELVVMIPSLGREDPLEQEMVKHSSILAWEIPWTGSVVDYSPRGCKELDMTEHVCTRTRLEPGPPGGSSDRQQGQDPWGGPMWQELEPQRRHGSCWSCCWRQREEEKCPDLPFLSPSSLQLVPPIWQNSPINQ